MTTRNIVDYLIPVSEAGDKVYSNGTQELTITKEDERKAQQRIDQIALQKHLDLERGNVQHILEMLQKDTPEAAIYRAMLLQQLEKQNKATAEVQKEDEDNKPGTVGKVARWIGNTALSTAKYVGYAALTHLALKSLLNAGEIYRNGLFPTWKSWQVANGIGRSPELAKQLGDEYAALENDIVKREVKLNDLPDNLRGKAFKFADDLAGKKVPIKKSKFILEDFFKGKDGTYLEDLPTGAKPEDYVKEWAFVLDTGVKNAQIPINKNKLGTNLFNDIFKVGDLTTLITEDDSWYMRPPMLRYLDNNLLHLGSLSGYNQRSRLNSKYTRMYYPGEEEELSPPEPKKQKILELPSAPSKHDNKKFEVVNDDDNEEIIINEDIPNNPEPYYRSPPPISNPNSKQFENDFAYKQQFPTAFDGYKYGFVEPKKTFVTHQSSTRRYNNMILNAVPKYEKPINVPETPKSTPKSDPKPEETKKSEPTPDPTSAPPPPQPDTTDPNAGYTKEELNKREEEETAQEEQEEQEEKKKGKKGKKSTKSTTDTSTSSGTSGTEEKVDEYSPEYLAKREMAETITNAHYNLAVLYGNIKRTGWGGEVHFDVKAEELDSVIDALATTDPDSRESMLNFTRVAKMNKNTGINEDFFRMVVDSAHTTRMKFPIDTPDKVKNEQNKKYRHSVYEGLIKMSQFANPARYLSFLNDVFLDPKYDPTRKVHINEGQIEQTRTLITSGVLPIVAMMPTPLTKAAAVISGIGFYFVGDMIAEESAVRKEETYIQAAESFNEMSKIILNYGSEKDAQQFVDEILSSMLPAARMEILKDASRYRRIKQYPSRAWNATKRGAHAVKNYIMDFSDFEAANPPTI